MTKTLSEATTSAASTIPTSISPKEPGTWGSGPSGSGPRDMPTSISPAIGELIELFSAHLPDVDFPNVNASSLEELSCKVAAAHTAVSELERQLHSAREVFSQAERILLDKSQSALGYAKVYAREDEELLEALSGIQIGKRKRAEIGKKKPRRSKKSPAAIQASSQGALLLSAEA